jgi:hypothetical protein
LIAIALAQATYPVVRVFGNKKSPLPAGASMDDTDIPATRGLQLHY